MKSEGFVILQFVKCTSWTQIYNSHSSQLEAYYVLKFSRCPFYEKLGELSI